MENTTSAISTPTTSSESSTPSDVSNTTNSNSGTQQIKKTSTNTGTVSKFSEGKKLFIGNLDYEATQQDLKAIFEAQSKQVLFVDVLSGYGFVKVQSKEEAERLKELLNKTVVKGRAINIELATDAKRARRLATQPANPSNNNNNEKKKNQSAKNKNNEWVVVERKKPKTREEIAKGNNNFYNNHNHNNKHFNHTHTHDNSNFNKNKVKKYLYKEKGSINNNNNNNNTAEGSVSNNGSAKITKNKVENNVGNKILKPKTSPPATNGNGTESGNQVNNNTQNNNKSRSQGKKRQREEKVTASKYWPKTPIWGAGKLAFLEKKESAKPESKSVSKPQKETKSSSNTPAATAPAKNTSSPAQDTTSPSATTAPAQASQPKETSRAGPAASEAPNKTSKSAKTNKKGSAATKPSSTAPAPAPAATSSSSAAAAPVANAPAPAANAAPVANVTPVVANASLVANAPAPAPASNSASAPAAAPVAATTANPKTAVKTGNGKGNASPKTNKGGNTKSAKARVPPTVYWPKTPVWPAVKNSTSPQPEATQPVAQPAAAQPAVAEVKATTQPKETAKQAPQPSSSQKAAAAPQKKTNQKAKKPAVKRSDKMTDVVVVRILSYLQSPKSLATCSVVCKNWNKLAKTPALWQTLGSTLKGSEKINSADFNWQEFFENNFKTVGIILNQQAADLKNQHKLPVEVSWVPFHARQDYKTLKNVLTVHFSNVDGFSAETVGAGIKVADHPHWPESWPSEVENIAEFIKGDTCLHCLEKGSNYLIYFLFKQKESEVKLVAELECRGCGFFSSYNFSK